jgi:hypothetical protein
MHQVQRVGIVDGEPLAQGRSLLLCVGRQDCGDLHLGRRHDDRLGVTEGLLLTALGTCCVILGAMRSRALRIIAGLALLTCLICPLVETFDTWDHTIQTGNDTEYTLVVVALCVGVAYSFARFIFQSALLGFVANSVSASCVQKSFLSAACSSTVLLFAATSPPLLPLRI